MKHEKDVKKKEVSVLMMDTPVALTLTGAPANQVGFRVVRRDSGEEVSVPVRRIRRSRSGAAFLYIEFPLGTTAEEVEKVAGEYGIEDYEVVQDNDKYLLRRKDYQEAEGATITVSLGEGRKVVMVRTDSEDPARQEGLKLISITLDKEVFRSEEDAKAYLTEKEIDFTTSAIENTDTSFVFRRSEGDEGKVGKIELEDGVIVSVVRAETYDVPQSIVEVVSEAAYGSFGIGQLDFAAMLADVEFSRLSEEATYRLQRVLDNIILYSSLPVAVRKELVQRAAMQYALYIGNLMDGLPQGVVLVNRSSKPKEHDMTAAATPATPTPATEVQNAAPITETEVLTRSDVSAMIQEAVTAAIAAKAAEEVKRSDEPAPEPEAKPAAPAVDPVLEELQTITRSMGELAGNVAKVAERVNSLEGATVVRSDNADNGVAETPAKKDIFSGVFNRA